MVVEITGTDYEIHQWKLEETIDWEPEQYLNLLDVDDLTEE